MNSGIIHEIFNQYYKNTVLFPITYDNLKELEQELIAEIQKEFPEVEGEIRNSWLNSEIRRRLLGGGKQ